MYKYVCMYVYAVTSCMAMYVQKYVNILEGLRKVLCMYVRKFASTTKRQETFRTHITHHKIEYEIK